MKAMVAAALAVALGAVQLAGQSPVESRKFHKGRTVDSASPQAQVATGMASGKRQHQPLVHGGWDASLLRSQGQAVQLLQPLCDGSSKDPAMATRQVGAALLEVENQMSALEKNATGNEKTELASFRGHESQARLHYTELLKATNNSRVARQHALAIRRELVAARGTLRVTATDSWDAQARPVKGRQ